jgi:TonB family protein
MISAASAEGQDSKTQTPATGAATTTPVQHRQNVSGVLVSISATSLQLRIRADAPQLGTKVVIFIINPQTKVLTVHTGDTIVVTYVEDQSRRLARLVQEANGGVRGVKGTPADTGGVASVNPRMLIDPHTTGPSTAVASTASSKGLAAGGGPGLVWVNKNTNVYYSYGSSYYGKTKQGQYMSEADAKALGARPDHGSAYSQGYASSTTASMVTLAQANGNTQVASTASDKAMSATTTSAKVASAGVPVVLASVGGLNVDKNGVKRTPVILYRPTPAYTISARDKKIEGSVALKADFCATGKVEVLDVVRPLGYGLDDSAIAAAKQIRFTPALGATGEPVDWQGIVVVNFLLGMDDEQNPGQVVSVDKGQIVINHGINQGLMVGSMLQIIRKKQSGLVDAATGKPNAAEENVGEAVITSVNDNSATATYTGTGILEVGDLVRLDEVVVREETKRALSSSSRSHKTAAKTKK